MLFTGSVFPSFITLVSLSAEIMCLQVKHKRRLLIDKLLSVICRELLSFAKCVTRSLLLSFASWRRICGAAGNQESCRGENKLVQGL